MNYQSSVILFSEMEVKSRISCGTMEKNDGNIRKNEAGI